MVVLVQQCLERRPNQLQQKSEWFERIGSPLCVDTGCCPFLSRCCLLPMRFYYNRLSSAFVFLSQPKQEELHKLHGLQKGYLGLTADRRPTPISHPSWSPPRMLSDLHETSVGPWIDSGTLSLLELVVTSPSTLHQYSHDAYGHWSGNSEWVKPPSSTSTSRKACKTD